MLVLNVIDKYKYLFIQLVKRDFKTKYKRSILGVFWSLLNPLLLMCVQYVVFSNLFRYEIEHYVIYLLIGIIFFTFFNDSTSQSMAAVVMNAPLITKVYVPKYVFPMSKVISAEINFIISIGILFIAILLNGLRITPLLLLLIIPVIGVTIFSMGIGLLLSALMVYFRDMQFLYGIITTMWMYLTPVFYPESILADKMAIALKINPLYHLIKFSRTIVIDNTIPPIQDAAVCLLVPIAVFILCALIFRKLQRNFVLYL